MKHYNKRILLVSIILIFLLFASYNIGVATIHYKYHEVTDANIQLEKIITDLKNNTINNEQLISQLKEINEEIYFINAFCFNNNDLDELIIDNSTNDYGVQQ